MKNGGIERCRKVSLDITLDITINLFKDIRYYFTVNLFKCLRLRFEMLHSVDDS